MLDKVKILGTEYRIIIDNEMHRTDRDGATKCYSHEIQLRPDTDMLDDESTDYEKKLRAMETARHELFHAFFRESGLDDYCQNEQLVDWLAIQSPKIFKVFQKLDLL